LADYVLVQHRPDLLRLGQVIKIECGYRSKLLIDDLIAEFDALIADVNARASDQLLDLPLRLAAEGAKKLFVCLCWFRHGQTTAIGNAID
jgi:hypothetical protein